MNEMIRAGKEPDRRILQPRSRENVEGRVMYTEPRSPEGGGRCSGCVGHGSFWTAKRRAREQNKKKREEDCEHTGL